MARYTLRKEAKEKSCPIHCIIIVTIKQMRKLRFSNGAKITQLSSGQQYFCWAVL
jgi:hypothetical protein